MPRDIIDYGRKPRNVTEVLVVVSTLAETGPVNLVYDLLSELDDSISASVLTLSPEGESSRVADFEAIGVAVETLGLGRVESAALGSPRLYQAVSRRNPDVVHTHGLRADLLAALALHHVPTVTTLHTDPRKDYTELYGRVRGGIAASLHLLAVRGIDRQVACSAAVAECLDRYLPDVQVIRNGVQQETYRPVDDTSRYRRQLQLPEGEPIFVSAGAFIERKRPMKVLEGFQSSDVTGHLVMLGDGPLRDRCRSLAGDAVTLPGYVDEVLPYFHAADFYVSASAAEGLPLAPMEALGCGLPVALSNIRPHEEILSFDERAGTLYDSNRVSECAAAFRSLVQRDYESASAAARGIVTEHLNSGRMAAAYADLYHELANR